MMKKSFVLGIDGGGSKTTAVLMENQDTVRGRARAGSTNWNSVGIEAAHSQLQSVISATLLDGGISAEQVRAVCLGASGVDRPHDRARVTGWLRELLPQAKMLVHNDAVIALASGTGGEVYGIVLISGTGMICYGFDRAGNRERAGGWGALLGDMGSGYALGAAVLKAITWASDDRAPQTRLSEAVLTHLELEQTQGLIDWTYRDISWERIASLAPFAIELATIDPIAARIVEEGATALAVAVQAVASRLDFTESPFPLVMAGGMLRPGFYFDQVSQQIQSMLPQANLIRPTVEPAVGAALLALRAISEKTGFS